MLGDSNKLCDLLIEFKSNELDKAMPECFSQASRGQWRTEEFFVYISFKY